MHLMIKKEEDITGIGIVKYSSEMEYNVPHDSTQKFKICVTPLFE